MSSTTVPSPRPAATTALVRDRNGDIDVLMLRRAAESGFAADCWVFPGGVVDPADRLLPPHRYRGVDVHGLAERFAEPASSVLGFHVAAARETFEEAGVLFASGDFAGVDLDMERRHLATTAADAPAFSSFLDRHDLVVDLGALVYLSRWITPRLSERRYDTAFFVAEAPGGQVPRPDGFETTEQRWLRPAQALDAHRAGAMPMMRPTVATLAWLADHGSAATAAAAARAQPAVPWVLPHVERRPDGSRVVLHPASPDFPVDDYADDLRGPIR